MSGARAAILGGMFFAALSACFFDWNQFPEDDQGGGGAAGAGASAAGGDDDASGTGGQTMSCTSCDEFFSDCDDGTTCGTEELNQLCPEDANVVMEAIDAICADSDLCIDECSADECEGLQAGAECTQCVLANLVASPPC